MAVKIRLARGGAKKLPYYRIVVANNTAPRDGDFIEKVGIYDPMINNEADRVKLKTDRVEYWLNKGAEPTERVAKFIDKAGVTLPDFVRKQINVRLKSQKPRPSKAKKE